MSSIINEIYEGGLTYAEIIQLSENQKSVRKVSETENELRDKLKDLPELLAIYEKYVDKVACANAENYKNFYATGVRIGLLLGMDAAKLTPDD